MRFAASILARRDSTENMLIGVATITEHRAMLVWGKDSAEAGRLALEHFQQMFPPADGWNSYSVELIQVPEQES